MRYACLCKDRAELVATVEKETGLKAVYNGSPGFSYTIGDNIVLRDGTLECRSNELACRLVKHGLIEKTPKEESDSVNSSWKRIIAFPIKGWSGKNLINLVSCIAVREELINKAINRPHAFCISGELMDYLKQRKPSTIPAFLEAVRICGGRKAIRGIHITENEISFPGFPVTAANRALAEALVRDAIKRKFVHAKIKNATNEKFSFQVWLYEIGLKGQQNKRVRRELLRYLDGDSTFSTPERKAEYHAKRKKPNPEPDFILL